MKELNKFRQFINEGPEDIDIMGQKFNFNDICPGAHKAIANLAKEYANNDVMLGDLLYLANLHQTFFNLEKKALGPQGIDADDLNNIKELYVDINNIANNAFGEEVGKEVKTYMDMHMDKIKKAGLKASEPGGSSDTSYAQDWADEQDAMYGKANFVEENDKALDAVIKGGASFIKDKTKDFLLKILFKTADFVSPDTLKYVYKELVNKVGVEEANETFQELNLDPKKYVNEGETNEQITPDELRKEFYKGMQIMDSALAKAKGTIPQEQWDELYAVVTKVEDVAENIGE
jgi:hypothetical protein